MKKPILLAAAFAAVACIASADAGAPVVSLPASVTQALRAISSASALREVAPADVSDAKLAAAIEDLAASLADVDRTNLIAFLEAEIAALTPELMARTPQRIEGGVLIESLENLLDEQARRILILPRGPSDPERPKTRLEACVDQLSTCLLAADQERSPFRRAVVQFRCYLDFLMCITSDGEGTPDNGGLADPRDQPQPSL